ncbi:MAG: PspA/IM30 family protein [Candidatus Obscuribacterales bacterium]|jgi:phage shock protein A
MFSRFMSLVRAMFGRVMGQLEDPEMMLEQKYQELQSNLIQVRQAVAQAIATEKQLEQSLQKNRDQAATWENRARMAVQQNNDDLARQALQRKTQYSQAAADLEAQLNQQREHTAQLRERLTSLEGEVQKAYTKKQVLIARDKAAQATTRANEIMAKTTSSGAMSVIERMEQKVVEREAKAAALAELGSDTLDKKFKDFEGQVDIEAELMALKGTMGGPKLIVDNKVKEPVSAQKDESLSVEAEDVTELDESK